MRKNIIKIYFFFLKIFFPIGFKTFNTAGPVRLKLLFFQKFLGFNRYAYWPTHYTSTISSPKNILIGVGTAPGLSPGCYISGGGNIYLGDYTLVGPNVGIISSNHDIYENNKSIYKSVKIGKYCWIGMNSVILPGVELGDFTIVAAGSVVSKSFKDGFAVIGGTPAKIIKILEKEKCVEYKNKYEYVGFIKKENFDKYRNNNLNV